MVSVILLDLQVNEGETSIASHISERQSYTVPFNLQGQILHELLYQIRQIKNVF